MKPVHFIIFFIALLIGYFIDDWKLSSKPSKHYPIEVIVLSQETQTEWSHSYKMDADSVKQDTIWKDGVYIVNKNIINLVFK
jgi:hypothetical protein